MSWMETSRRRGCTPTPRRWVGDNGPRPTDWEANSNLINIAAGAMKAAQGDLARFVFVTSAGVERQKELPWAILNLYGESRASHSLRRCFVRPSAQA